MASNQLPTPAGPLIGLGKKMSAGLTALGTTLGITQITPAAFNTTLDNFIATDATYNAARSERQTTSDAFHTAEEALTGWLGMARNVLAARFGNRWSTQWAQAGFTNHTTAIPTRIEDRLALALLLVAFFTANPSYEVTSMGLTAAQGTALYNAANTTQQTYIAATMALKTKGDTDTTAYDALVDMMWSLIKILEATLADNDPRWLAFGLNMPATINPAIRERLAVICVRVE